MLQQLISWLNQSGLPIAFALGSFYLGFQTLKLLLREKVSRAVFKRGSEEFYERSAQLDREIAEARAHAAVSMHDLSETAGQVTASYQAMKELLKEKDAEIERLRSEIAALSGKDAADV